MEHPVPQPPVGQIHALRQKGSGQLFAYTPEMAARSDMDPYVGPATGDGSSASVQSRATIQANVEESRRQVDALLADARRELDAASDRSRTEREQFENSAMALQSENDALRQRVAELEAGAKDEPQIEPQPAAPTFSLPDGVDADNVEVLAHTDSPTVLTDADQLNFLGPEASLISPELVASSPAPVVIDDIS